jgi:type I restriction enzyme S subunit
MAAEWRAAKLGEVLGSKGYIRGPFGSALKRGELLTAGIPVYEQQHAIYGTREFRFFIDDAKYQELARFTVQPNDLIISCSGTLGRVSVIREGDPVGIISQALLILRPDTQLIDPSFLYYVLSSPAGFHSMVSVSTGSVQVNIAKRSIIEDIDLQLPPLPEQKAIARILGTLDDKIELNRRMNATLEAMARALFQSWFVDFDPVHAKAAGRPPSGMDAPTAALFPSDFQDSPLGKIPKGWDVEALSAHLNVVKGRSYKSSELSDSKTALVTLKSFQRGGGYRPDGLKGYTGDYKPDQRIFPGDLVVAYTDVTQAAEVIGKPAIVRSDANFGTLVASLDVGIVRPTSKRVPIPFLYCLFLTKQFQAHTYAHATGTTVLHLSSKAVPNYESCIPPQPIAEAFAELTNPLFQVVDQNEQQSRTLATLRDTLLPKLLSGELSTTAATAIIEASP